MKKFYRGSYTDASCQIWLHLAKQFQRRRFFLTLANQKQELPLAAAVTKNRTYGKIARFWL
jgi:hypothetical protein